MIAADAVELSPKHQHPAPAGCRMTAWQEMSPLNLT
jgi:hypothetical protein